MCALLFVFAGILIFVIFFAQLTQLYESNWFGVEEWGDFELELCDFLCALELKLLQASLRLSTL